MSRKLKATIFATVLLFAFSVYLSKQLSQIDLQITEQQRFREKKRYRDRLESWIGNDDQTQIKERLKAKK